MFCHLFLNPRGPGVKRLFFRPLTGLREVNKIIPFVPYFCILMMQWIWHLI